MKYRVGLVIAPLVFWINAVRNEPAPVKDFIEVRRGAKMHYCLHYAKTEVFPDRVMPLVIWLSDGLRRDSCTYGFYEEIGLERSNGSQRNSSWIQHVNVLFINSPVGIIQTMTSEVNQGEILPDSEEVVAEDLSVFIQQFYKRHNDLRKVPLHIYGETYGARMAIALAAKIWELTKQELVPDNIVSVNLITPWIEPVKSIMEWAPALYNNHLINSSYYDDIISDSVEIARLIAANQTSDAYKVLWLLMRKIYAMVGNIHFDDMRNFDIQDETREQFGVENLCKLMNWSHGSNKTEMTSRQELMSHLSKDYLKSYTEKVQYILNETFIEVIIISENVNLMTPLSGLSKWVDQMSWKNESIYRNASQDFVFSNKNMNIFKRDGDNFKTYWLYEIFESTPSDRESPFLFIMKETVFFKI